MVIIVFTIYRCLKRRGSSTIVSDVRLEHQYEVIHTINDNSASDQDFSNNIQEAETILDAPAVKRDNHHSSSSRRRTYSDDSAHSSDSMTSI